MRAKYGAPGLPTLSAAYICAVRKLLSIAPVVYLPLQATEAMASGYCEHCQGYPRAALRAPGTPPATVVIGGILSSTALTLLVLPLLYRLAHGREARRTPACGSGADADLQPVPGAASK